MASGFVGQAFIQISPSFTGFQSEAAKKITAPLQNVGAQAGRNLGQGVSKETGAGLEDTTKKTQTFGQRFKETFAGVLAANVVQNLAGQVWNFGKQSVAAYENAEQTNIKFHNALARIPGASDKVTNSLAKQATALSKTTVYSAGQTKQADATLASYGLTGKQLEQLLPLVQDYATKTGQDLPTAAQSVGRALLGNGRALKSVGINFKNTGSVAGNFQEVVDGLHQKVGGMATEMGGTAAGKMAIMKNQITALQVSLGGALMPAIQKVLVVLIPFVNWIGKNISWLLPLGTAIMGVVAAMKIYNLLTGEGTIATLAHAVAQGAVTVATYAWTAAQWLLNAAMDANPIVLIAIAIIALIAIIVLIATKTTWFQTAWNAVWAGVAAAISWVWGVIRIVFNALVAAWNWVYAAFIAVWHFIYAYVWAPLVAAALWMYGILRTVFVAIVGAWNWLYAGFMGTWHFIYAYVWKPLVAAATWMWGMLRSVFVAIVAAWNWLYAGFMAVWHFIYSYVWTPLVTAARWVWGMLNTVFAAIRVAFSAVGTGFQWVYNTLLHPVIALFQLGVQTAGTIINTVFGAIRTAWSAVGTGFQWVWQNVILRIFNAFRSAVGALRDAFNAAVNVMKAVWQSVVNAVAAPARTVAFKIINPLVKGANFLLSKIGLSIPLIPRFEKGGPVPESGLWGLGRDRTMAMLEPGEWVLTRRQARAIGYGRLANLPHYAEGGPVGLPLPPAPQGRYGATVDPWSPFDMWGPKWVHPANWGRAIAGVVTAGFGALWKMTPEQIRDPLTKLFRWAAVQALNKVIDPLIARLQPLANQGPPDFFTGVLARLALLAIEKFRSWLVAHSEQPSDASGLAAAVVAEATKQLGKPYVWGARGPNAFDCSGLIDWSFGTAPGSPKVGWKGPRVGPTTEQQSKLGKKINEKDAQPGDLWFWGNPIHHVALSIGGNRVIQAPKTGDVVKISTVWHSEPTQLRRIIEQTGNVGSPVGPVGNLRPIVIDAFKRLGKPANDDWVNAVLQIIKAESGGNPNAINNWDSNAKKGTPSIGLMQVIGPTFAQYHVAGTSGNIRDPLANVAAGINYSFSRYGNIMNVPGIKALAGGGKYVGYDEGGWLPPGATLTFNDTGRPEAVLTAAQWDALQTAAQNGEQGQMLQLLKRIAVATEEGRSLMVDGRELAKVVDNNMAWTT